MANDQFTNLLEKYKIALTRLEWALNELSKKPKEIRIEDNSKLDELSKEIRDLISELDRKDEIIASLRSSYVNNNESLKLTNEESTTPTFGLEFPNNPTVGQQFLRVDSTPNKLYKFNGYKWILVDRKLNSNYTIDKKLAEFMILALKKGEMEWEDLTESEQNAIKPYLTKEKNLGR
jgi:hypothetical protein